MLVLGIESSCDDTCAAVVRDGIEVLSNAVSSQQSIHSKYGGIVPEIASRHHLECLLPVIGEAIEQASISLEDIDGVAATQGPGLIGSLLVGLSAAKAMAYAKGLPLVPVNHLMGHLYSPVLSEPDLVYPHLGMVISGGHTSLYRVKSPTEVALLGGTRDDAAGEAFDKVGKCLGLPYPGGPEIEKQAARFEEGAPIRFPRPKFKTGGIQFSFSGLKTAVAQYVEKLRREEKVVEVPRICFSFQEAVLDCLVEQVLGAFEQEELDTLTISGGVAANGALRRRFEQECSRLGKTLVVAERKYCTDNAAMIAGQGYHVLKADGTNEDYLSLNAYARLPVGG